ncbi:MAG: sirohydrochlorin chelatase [Nocardioidaceae bacterium]
MTAPALVALACAPDDRAAATLREIVATTRRLRPDLQVAAAVTARSGGDLPRVVSRLAAQGSEEIVVVPLLVALPDPSELDVVAVVDEAAHLNPGVLVRVTAPVGPDAALLTVLDERLRTALSTAKARELDALVLVATGSSDLRLTTSVTRLARLWSARHHLPTSIAFANTTPPSTGEAVREWRRKGKRHVAVGSLFILSGPHARRAAELALEAGAQAVSAPLGAHQELSRLIVSRYVVGALELVPF